ncbi:hypothetical protein TSMEX_010158 [Taenia solium]|eukprot:TsM_000746400 transcript=TsM_000746400 gene=TsM_000746400
MDRMKKVMSWSNRPPELVSVLPPYCNMILTNVEEIRPRIHDYRKQLDKSTNLLLSSWGKFDSGNICTKCPLWCLIKTQEVLVSAQRKFLEGSVGQLIKSLKSWEEECSQLLKKKLDLQRALMDMNKVRDKQRQGRDNESAKNLINFTECTYNSQREDLIKDLSHYVQSEMNYQAKIKNFLEEQVKLLDSCRAKTDNLLNTTCLTSSGCTNLAHFYRLT